MGIFDALGQGLQGAGGVLSPQVFQDNQRQREQQQQQAEKMKMTAISAVESGSADPAILTKFGIDPGMFNSGPAAKARVAKLQADKIVADSLGGLQGSPLASSGQLMDALGKVPLGALVTSDMGPKLIAQASLMQNREAEQASKTQRATDAKEAKQQQMQFNYDRLQEMASQAEQNRELHRDNAEATRVYQGQSLALRAQLARMAADSHQQGIDLKMQDKKDAATAKLDQTTQTKVIGPADALINQIDDAISMVQKDPTIVGVTGKLSRGKEFVTGMFGDGANPASQFRTSILDLQNQYRHSPLGGGNKRFKADVDKEDAIVSGLGTFTSAPQVLDQLKTLKTNIQRRANAEAGKSVYDLGGGSTPAQQVGGDLIYKGYKFPNAEALNKYKAAGG